MGLVMWKWVYCGCGLLWVTTTVLAAGLDDSLQASESARKEAAASQQRIDQLQQQTDSMTAEYRRLTQGADSQQAQAATLQDTLAQQAVELTRLRQQLASVEVTQERIVPLMRTMADALEQFVALDVPFHQEERLGRVTKLKQQLASTSLALPDKYRALLAAFQQELELGRTLEAWRGELVLEQTPLTVEYLRVGRVGWYFQTLDGQRAGVWDSHSKQWHLLSREQTGDLRHALLVARNQQAPQLLALPLLAPVTEQVMAPATTPVAVSVSPQGGQ